MTIGFILKFIFLLPGTVLHELAHYIAALVFGKAEGFSIWPRKEGNNFVFGTVKSRTRYKVLSSFIAIAPVFWWAVIFIILRHLHLIDRTEGVPGIHVDSIVGKLKTFTYKDAFAFWLFAQLLWAGRPSSQDIKNFFGGFFSVSGFLFLSVAAGLIYMIRYSPLGR